MFAEKIFILVWFWLAFILLLTVLSTASWVQHLAIRWTRVRFVRRYIKVMKENREFEAYEKKKKFRDNLNRFINQFLSVDGVFLLILISSNAGVCIIAVFYSIIA